MLPRSNSPSKRRRCPMSSEASTAESGAAIPAAIAAELAELRKEIEDLRARMPEEKAALVVFSGDLDRAVAAFIIATGAAVAGLETTLFFTFWGLSILKKKNAAAVSQRDLMQRMFTM